MIFCILKKPDLFDLNRIFLFKLIFCICIVNIFVIKIIDLQKLNRFIYFFNKDQ